MSWNLSPPARMVWEQLRPRDRKALQVALDGLAARPDVDCNPSVKTISVGQELVRVFRAPLGYRVFFELEENDRILVIDIASRAQIDFLRPPADSAAA